MNKLWISRILLASIDFLSCYCSIVITWLGLSLTEQDIFSYIPMFELKERLIIHLGISLFSVSWFWFRLRHYTYRKPFWFELKEIIRTLIILAIIELAIIAFSKLYSSRYVWVLTWSLSLILVPLGRVIVKIMLIKTGLYIKDAVIIGSGENALEAYKALNSEPYLGLKIKAFIASQQDSCDLLHLDIPIFYSIDRNTYQNINSNDQFVIALEDDEVEQRDFWLRYFAKKNYRSVSVIPSLRGLPLYSTNMAFLFSYDVILLRVNNNLAKISSRVLKRIMDIFVSLMIILSILPILLLLYFLVKKDGGDAIYGHERIGHNGKPFKCLKFRSMVVNSKEVLEKVLSENAEARAEWDKDFKLKDDPRITRVGKFLRKTSLDELPQLFNVLKGEMSLVGPRPVVREELERYGEDVDYYLMAKPGMTGLWQVSGRNNVDYKTRVYFDAWYVKNWSLWNDMVILFKTINVVLNRSGAY